MTYMSPQEMQTMFLQEVQLGEELLAEGKTFVFRILFSKIVKLVSL